MLQINIILLLFVCLLSETTSFAIKSRRSNIIPFSYRNLPRRKILQQQQIHDNHSFQLHSSASGYMQAANLRTQFFFVSSSYMYHYTKISLFNSPFI